MFRRYTPSTPPTRDATPINGHHRARGRGTDVAAWKCACQSYPGSRHSTGRDCCRPRPRFGSGEPHRRSIPGNGNPFNRAACTRHRRVVMFPNMNSPGPVAHRKPHSHIVTDGIERAAARGMLRAVGMGDDDWRKPQIGVASSWNEITPCNLSLARLAKAAKQGVFDADGYPREFGTISVSDGIAMGHSGMHYSLISREVIADSVETVL